LDGNFLLHICHIDVVHFDKLIVDSGK
jgi:hypothetical protein